MRHRAACLVVVVLAACGASAKHDAAPPKPAPTVDAAPASTGLRGKLHNEGIWSEDVTLDGLSLEIAATRCAGKAAVYTITAKYHPAKDPKSLTELLTIVVEPGRLPAMGEKFKPTVAAEERSGVAATVTTYVSEGVVLPHDAWIIVDRAEKNGPLDVRLWADFGAMGTIEGRIVAPEVHEIVCVH